MKEDGVSDRRKSSYTPTWLLIPLLIAMFLVVRYFDRERAISERLGNTLRAESLIDKGQIDSALAMLNTLLAANPEDDRLYTLRGRALRVKGETERAAGDIEKAISIPGGGSTDAYFERAMLARTSGQPDRALADLDAVLQKKPDFGPAYFERSLVRSDRRDVYGALEDLNRAIAIAPRASWLAARARIKLLDLNQASAAADDFATAAREAIEYRDAMVIVLGADGDTAGGRSEPGKPFAPEAFYLLARAHYARVHAGQDDREEMKNLAVDLAAPIVRRQMAEAPIQSFDQARARAFTEWPGPIYRMFLGEITKEDLLAMATQAPASQRARWRCDASFYIATLDLANRRNMEATAGFESASALCSDDSLEGAFARRELGPKAE